MPASFSRFFLSLLKSDLFARITRQEINKDLNHAPNFSCENFKLGNQLLTYILIYTTSHGNFDFQQICPISGNVQK